MINFGGKNVLHASPPTSGLGAPCLQRPFDRRQNLRKTGDIRSISEIEPIYSLKGKRVWVAGHRGMVGSALVRRLEGEDCVLLTVNRDEVDLTRQEETEA